MSFPQYEEYKESGVEWLGEIPTEWEVCVLKYACSNQPSNVDKKSVDGQVTVRLCNYTDVYYHDAITKELEFMAATASDLQIERFTLKAGDVIITKDSETADDIAVAAYVPEDLPGVICGYHLAMIRPKDGVSGAFIKWLFDSTYIRSRVATLANGLTRVGLSHSAISGLKLPLPPLPEQRAIAAFLDRETSKIDALVAEQRRLIELLKEKRQAVISHAVTKGLDPNVPMKDSGIAWLGKVPEHWEVRRFGWMCDYISYGFTNPMPTTDEGPYMLTANDVDFGNVKYDTARRTSQGAYDTLLTDKCRPIKDDLLLTKDGTLGRVAIHDGRTSCINQSVALLRVNKKELLPEFACAALQGGIYQRRMIYEAGGTTIKHIYISRLAKMPMAKPSLDEQIAILARLLTRLDTIDKLIGEAEQSSNLLQERRTALISAAVTGKIDVRQFAPEEAVA